MSSIATADLHFNDKPGDAYRWGLFPWLEQHQADELLILGDLTDAKDKHSAQLVNRLYNAVTELAVKFKIIIIKGNHDCLSPDHPFFAFLGNNSDIVFVSEPQKIKLSIGTAFFVPALTDWDKLKLSDTDFLFTHATFDGAKAENGQTLTGVNPRVLESFSGTVYSGDIHTPQKIGNKIEYVGAPYHTRFGDRYEPRILHLLDNGKRKELYYYAPRKFVFDISVPEDLLEETAKAGDHVKIRCHLRRSEYVQWRLYRQQIREIVETREWVFFGSEAIPVDLPSQKGTRDKNMVNTRSVDLMAAYIKKHRASAEHARIGQELLVVK